MPTTPTSRLRRLSSALAVAALATVCAAAFVLSPTPAQGRSTGANPGFAGNITGGSGPQTCTVCHNTSALNAGSGSVTIDAPETATAGETVTITVNVDNQTPTTGTRRQGFQATVRDSDGDVQGDLVITDAANTKHASTTAAYVTHANAGQTTWSFDWTVGSEAGTATIYAAGNAADGLGTTSGDLIYATTAEVTVAAVDAEDGPAPAFTLGAPAPSPLRSGQTAGLALTLDRPGDVSARLIDGLGRTVRVLADGPMAGAARLAVPTAGLAAGLYTVVVDGPGGRRARTVAVVR